MARFVYSFFVFSSNLYFTENYGKVRNKPNFFNMVDNCLILLFVSRQKEAKKSSLNVARLFNVC